MSSSRSSSPASSAGVRAAEPSDCAPVHWRGALDARALLVVEHAGEKVLGPRFVRLLDGIGAHGSIRQAALEMGIGYRHALAWISRAERVLGRPLVVRHAGGVAGGGAGLTLDGIQLVRAYHRISRSLRRVVRAAERQLLGALPTVAAAFLLGALGACARGDRSANGDGTDSALAGTLVVFNAGSLARPLRAALDSFAAEKHITVQQENAGSLETARKLTELHKIPDVIGLADYEVFPQLLMPEQTTWYALFARNRMVVAYTDRSRGANEIDTNNWYEVLQRPNVEVARADPSLDPNGYRTLLVFQLAERHYDRPGLAARLLAAAPARNVRPKEADLVGLLQAGQMDFIWSYESIAQAAGLRYVTLPHEIDLSTPADSAFYATAQVRVAGKTMADSITFRGQPIVYAVSIPRQAPNPRAAEQFVAWLLSEDGRRVLRDAKLDALDRPLLAGTDIPTGVIAAVVFDRSHAPSP